MKTIIFLVMLFVLVLFLPTAAAAQMSGRWVQCVDPASGYIVQCFIPDQQVQQPVYSPQPPVYVQPQYSQPAYPGPQYGGPIYSQEPVYQTQRRKTVRQDYDVGISPYSRRPYGHYSRSTEKVTITVETNSPSYQPNIVVAYGNGYYYPSYRNW